MLGASIGVAAVLVVAGGFVIWLRSYHEDPIDVEQVVERYRGTETTASSSAPANSTATTGAVDEVSESRPDRGPESLPTTAAESPALPSPGVYVYETTGSEKVNALGGKTHHYPEETAATVTIDDDCVKTRWDALKQRWDENLLCPGDGGWHLDELITFHSFFRQDERREYSCEPGTMHVPFDADPGSTFTGYCESPGSGHSGTSTEEVTAEVIGVVTSEVDGEAVDVVNIRYEITIGGESEGAATVDRWFALEPAPLLVREVRDGYTDSDTAIGNVRYEERYEVWLKSMEPMR